MTRAELVAAIALALFSTALACGAWYTFYLIVESWN